MSLAQSLMFFDNSVNAKVFCSRGKWTPIKISLESPSAGSDAFLPPAFAIYDLESIISLFYHQMVVYPQKIFIAFHTDLLLSCMTLFRHKTVVLHIFSKNICLFTFHSALFPWSQSPNLWNTAKDPCGLIAPNSSIYIVTNGVLSLQLLIENNHGRNSSLYNY